MKIQKIKTKVLEPPKIDLFEVLDEYITKLSEGDIVFITSKIVSLHQGRCVKISEGEGEFTKDDLIYNEADRVIERNEYPDNRRLLTITKNLMICAAGIDESNANGFCILLPNNSNKFAREIHAYLKKKFQLERLGVVITDSHSVPLHRGALGTTIGYFGIEPLISHVGRDDIFGKKFKAEVTNVVDSLSATAVFMMGETNERIPMVVIGDIDDRVVFSDNANYSEFFIAPEDDMFSPILKKFKKVKNLKD